MFNSVEYIRSVCRQRKIPISQLEKDCGFANGYLHPKKLKKLPYDRAVTIANYLKVSVNMVLTGEEEQKENPTAQMGSEVDPVKSEILSLIDTATEDQLQDYLDMLRIVLNRREKR